MKKMFVLATGIALAAATGLALAEDMNRAKERTPATIADLGPAASDAVGMEILGRIEAKWSKVMQAYGWTADSFHQFREGYRNYPLGVLEEALAADTFERMESAFSSYATLRSRELMTKAYPARKAYPVNATTPDTSAEVIEAKNAAAKALGEDARDLVFVPIAPCTVWDTRFAVGVPFGPAIGNGVTRSFFSHWNGGGGNFSSYGGNPACTEANETFIGGRPFAVMMIVYVNNPAGNGWLTFYRAGDPDPSQATISVYYSPGPTRTQTVISKSARGYVGGATYDLNVTGRFSTADASASVVGYFIKPQATALDCTEVSNYGIAGILSDTFLAYGACTGGYTRTGGYCYGAEGHPTVSLLETGANGCVFRNTSGATTYSIASVSQCCRVPGR